MAKGSATIYASIAGAALGLAIGCVVSAPASWLARGIKTATGGHVLLEGAQGTVWSGSALVTLSGGAGSTSALTLPSRVNWKLTPRLGALAIELDAQCCTTNPIKAQLTQSGIEIERATAALPVALLQGLGAPWNSMAIAGSLNLHWQKLGVSWNQGKQKISGQIEAEASNVSTKLSTLSEVGTYQVVFKGGEIPQLDVSTKEGQLQLNGKGQWQAGSFSFEGTGQAQPGSAAALANLLTLLGERQGETTKIRFGKK